MSKNTASNAYRKVDVDMYDENRFTEDEVAAGDADQMSAVTAKEGQVRSLLNGGKNEEALKVAIKDPPVHSQDQQVKDKAFNSVMSVLTAIKTADVPNIVKNLSDKEVDVLVKYVYRGMEKATDGNSGILLAWHEKLVEVGGLGSIIRAMSDRSHV